MKKGNKYLSPDPIPIIEQQAGSKQPDSCSVQKGVMDVGWRVQKVAIVRGLSYPGAGENN